MDESKTLFISHATPEDNQFVLWIALRLMSLGYKVWCDLLNLSKGGDFWKEIEVQIRTQTCKFLLVQSVSSNSRDGVAKEIAVAQKVGKVRGDANFIIPLRIDNNLSYDDINVDLIRLNSIDFTNSWADGLKELMEALQKQKCPKSGEDIVSHVILSRLTNELQSPIEGAEVYDSNWFPLSDLPETLHFFPVQGRSEAFGWPCLSYKNYIVTFLEKDHLPDFVKSQLNADLPEYRLATKDYLRQDQKNDFIWSSTYRKLYIGVLAKVFDYSMRSRKGVSSRNMSKGVAFFYLQGVLDRDKVGRIQLVGKHKQYHWHFAISASIKQFPTALLQIRSHVVFSSDGKSLIHSDSIQHRARRSIGKAWWNKDWRARLLAFVKSLESVPGCGYFVLSEGIERPVRVSLTPMQFQSTVTYCEPGQDAEEFLKEIVTSEEIDQAVESSEGEF